MKLTRQIVKQMSKRYEQEFGVNPLQATRLNRVIIPRQCLILVLKRKYKLKEAHISDIIQMDRATAYHAIRRAEELLSVKDSYYVLAVQRWRGIMEEFESEMFRINSIMKHQTTLSIILDVLSKYPEEQSLLILQKAIQQIENGTDKARHNQSDER